jgi:acetolactate synthase I/II/III large subunit
MTPPPATVRARLPVVVLSGEAPINAKFYNQAIVVATGRHHIAAHSMRAGPVVLGVPYDLQKLPYSAKSPYVPSARFILDGGRPQPDPAQVAILVERIGSAECPVVLGGRGVLRSGAKAVPGPFAKAILRCGTSESRIRSPHSA